ncbi:hypothetical protein [Pseudoclavibacter helvolus]|uniref:hypothetical protein n=1 Tax=Pseudoclavibacter helvolus TaxID=255205 RepID=UPI0008393E62|nr:hypothetical protein [Pseudoclavibacter helvolus]
MSALDNETTTGTSRRALVQAAAWSVPVIAAAAATPMAAASQCTAGTLDWAALAAGTAVTTVTVPGTSPTTTATFTIAYSAGSTPSAASGRVAAGPQGGVTANYYRIEFAPPVANNAATVRIAFNRPVRGLSFSILDIDATTGYRDQVQVLTAGFTAVRQARVIGTGAAGDPFRMNEPYANIAPASNQGNVQLTWAGQVSAVEFRYFQPNAATNSQNMLIGLGNLAVNPC